MYRWHRGVGWKQGEVEGKGERKGEEGAARDFFLITRIHEECHVVWGLSITGNSHQSASIICFFFLHSPILQRRQSSFFLPACGVWTVRLTARINNRQITAESSVFKHSLKSHQPRGEANEDRGGGGREGGKLTSYNNNNNNNYNSAVWVKYTQNYKNISIHAA